ncbi:MAG: hypothetical protein AAF806_07180, partial [Bacteroidota bacterium]
GRKLNNFLPPQTLLKWKVKKELFSPSAKITEEPYIKQLIEDSPRNYSSLPILMIFDAYLFLFLRKFLN